MVGDVVSWEWPPAVLLKQEGRRGGAAGEEGGRGEAAGEEGGMGAAAGEEGGRGEAAEEEGGWLWLGWLHQRR